MATYLTQQSLLKKLGERGIKFSRQSLHSYQRKGLFAPDRTIAYGRVIHPLYTENDVNRLYNLITRRYRSKKARYKGMFLNGIPDRSE
jgi:DNA-binding transcriptional MerR regulator